MVSVFIEPADGVTGRADRRAGTATSTCPRCCPGRRWPPCSAFSPLPLLADAPGDVPRGETLDERVLLLWFLDEDPTGCLGRASSPPRPRRSPAPDSAGCVWASPFVGTVPGHRHLHRPAVVGAGVMRRLRSSSSTARAAGPGLGVGAHPVGADRAPGRGHPRRRAGPRGHRQGAHLRRLPRRLPAGRRRALHRLRGVPGHQR